MVEMKNNLYFEAVMESRPEMIEKWKEIEAQLKVQYMAIKNIITKGF